MTDHRIGRPAFGPWADPSRRAATAVAGLAAIAWVLVVDVLWTVVGIATVGDLVQTPTESWFDHYDLITMIIGWVYLASLLFAATTFIRWQRISIRNLAFFGCENPEHGTGIATAGWFIPFASLVLPYLSMREIARWSRPPGGPDMGGILGWWWGTWVVSGVIVSISSAVFQLESTSTTWISAAAIDAIGSIGLVASAVLAVKIVRTVNRRQCRLREVLRAEPQ